MEYNIYYKTDKERLALKIAKKNYKQSLKNKVRYNSKRDETLQQILSSITPRWGSIKIIALK